jgi:hypothetical protein
MIAPATNYTFKGVLWYQGESNASRGFQYRELFARMIKDWRKKFNHSALPFVYVQLPNYKKIVSKPVDSDWAETRESQAEALKLLIHQWPVPLSKEKQMISIQSIKTKLVDDLPCKLNTMYMA